MFPDRFCITSIERIIYVTSDEYKAKHLSFNTRLSTNELILHLSGQCMVYFNGKQLEARGEMIRFLPQGEATEYTVVNSDAPSCIDIFFRTDIPLENEAFLIDVSDKKRIESLFRKAFSIWSGKENGYYLKALSALYDIFGEICQKHYIPKDKYAIIEPAVKYISENYLFKMISVADLAELCDISESYLKKLFIANYGIPPKKYITKLKMEYAAELLSSGMFSVGSTANATGFENIYHFSSAFKKYMGISPSDYMKRYKSLK